MIKASTEKELNRVLDYIRPDKGCCIYLYIDLLQYGLEHDFLDLWYDEDGENINFVVMRYHDSLQIYSDVSYWDDRGLLDIIEEYDIKAVNAKTEMLDVLMPMLPGFEKRSGWMFEGRTDYKNKLNSDVKVEVASEEDAEEIAELMCSTEHWRKLYDVESLAEQLRERIRTGMGRSFVIRENGKIVAHDGTSAETEDMVMCSGLTVKKECIDKMYGAILGEYMNDLFLREGKVKYFHLSDAKRMKLFKIMGNKFIAETGKLIKTGDTDKTISRGKAEMPEHRMSDSAKVIYDLLVDIDELCRKNNIEYFLSNRLALIAYRGDRGDDYDLGRIAMTAENLKRFIKAYKKVKKKDRTIEWMGNSENFPGVFLRYIDTNSVYYTSNRMRTEKELGMFVTIDVLRPAGKREKYYRAIENAWRNLSFGMPAGGKKWETHIIKAMKIGCSLFGKKNVSKLLFKFLLNQYKSKNFHSMCYMQGDVKRKERYYYPTNLFSKSRDVRLYDSLFKAPSNLKQYVRRLYGTPEHIGASVIAESSINYFCDPKFSYKELDLPKYRDEIKTIGINLDLEARNSSKVIKERRKCFDLMYRSYYRYYYGLVVFRDMDYIESLYQNEQFEELDKILVPYYQLALKFGRKGMSLFIGERVDRLLEKRYHIDVRKKFPRPPKSFKNGFKIYDIKGELQKTIWR